MSLKIALRQGNPEAPEEENRGARNQVTANEWLGTGSEISIPVWVRNSYFSGESDYPLVDPSTR